MAIFLGEPGLAGFIVAKDDERGSDNWSYKPCKALSSHHHQQTNTQLFIYQMPFLSPNQQCQCTEGTNDFVTWLRTLLLLTVFNKYQMFKIVYVCEIRD